MVYIFRAAATAEELDILAPRFQVLYSRAHLQCLKIGAYGTKSEGSKDDSKKDGDDFREVGLAAYEEPTSHPKCKTLRSVSNLIQS